jgi:hypothetical protein
MFVEFGYWQIDINVVYYKYSEEERKLHLKNANDFFYKYISLKTEKGGSYEPPFSVAYNIKSVNLQVLTKFSYISIIIHIFLQNKRK